MLPGRSGLDVCHAIRAHPGKQPGIILMSVRAEEVDAVLGLSTGADDYVRKPFSITEVIARCRSVIARTDRDATGPVALPLPPAEMLALRNRTQTLTFGGVSIDPRRRELWLGDSLVGLTPTEFDLVHFLACSPGQVFTRSDLLERVRGYESDVYARTVDCHVARLRKKITDLGGPKDLVQTVFRVGYRFNDRVAAAAPATTSEPAAHAL
jgi:two-component system response regulator VicR/two-component system response regulator ResD